MNPTRPTSVSARAILQEMRRCGIDHVTTTPDFVQLSVHARLDAADSGVRTTYCANENQALQLAMGLIVGGCKPAVIMQNQGLYNCVNSLRACGLDARMPLFMMIGQFGREFSNVGYDPRESRRRMVSLLLPVLDAMRVRYWLLESPDDLGVFAQAWKHAREKQAPTAVIVGHDTEWD
jgi:sulfopyruvate decarboxylase TPP-binding subunit